DLSTLHSITTPATTSPAYTPPATDSHEIVDPHSATCLVLCDATGHRRRGGPIRDPPGISVPLRRTHDRNPPRGRLSPPHCRAARSEEHTSELQSRFELVC